MPGVSGIAKEICGTFRSTRALLFSWVLRNATANTNNLNRGRAEMGACAGVETQWTEKRRRKVEDLQFCSLEVSIICGGKNLKNPSITAMWKNNEAYQDFLSHFEIYLGKWVVKFNFMTVNKYSFLSSNCTKKSANNAPIEYKYPTIIYGYLDSWLFCTVKPVVCVRYASLSALLFPPCKR